METAPPTHIERKLATKNPWYLLATLYGEIPSGSYNNTGELGRDVLAGVAGGVRLSASDQVLHDRNRRAWNRLMSRLLDEAERARLVAAGRCAAEELVQFDTHELDELKRDFVKRGGDISVLLCEKEMIDFEVNEFTTFDVRGFVFPLRAKFGMAAFSAPARFNGATFLRFAEFTAAEFFDSAGFNDTAFCGPTIFGQAIFSASAHFLRSTFFEIVTFDGVRFATSTWFSDTTFFEASSFKRSSFSALTLFSDAKFHGSADFTEATFDNAVFIGAKFFGRADFARVMFSGPTDFSNVTFLEVSSFINGEMKNTTSFKSTVFERQPPDFFGTSLHEGTVWRDAQWPIPHHDKNAGRYVDAYERLKLEMDRLKKHQDELDFFALELQSRRALAGRWKGLPIALYGCLSDYGRNYVRPLLGLLLTALIGTLLFLPHFGFSKYEKAVGISLASTFGILGLRKDFVGSDTLALLPNALVTVASLQTIVGAVMLFLFGLAVRNRFRMR
jgi:uncharacterized protein YjbI with pentapeptide repeats